jgi:hypothetical protein
MWNKVVALVVLVAAASLFTPIEARRGGGGGGRGAGGGGRSGGGAYRGGNTMNRTPTMSRAANRPASVSGPRQQGQFQQRTSTVNRGEMRNQVNRYAAQSRPAANIDRQALTQRAHQNFSSNRANQLTQNRQLSDRTSQNLRQTRPNSNQWFNRNFFDHHNINRDYVRGGANWWRPAAWATLATWGAWGWSSPYYYDTGGDYYPVSTSEYSSYSPDYYSSPMPSTQPVQTAPAPAESTADEWLPLGVYAITSTPGAQSNRFIQLAINRSGEIAGVFYNATTDTAQDITGMVDPNNQRALWTLTNKANSPIASTGLYNLTEDQTPINVHFIDGTDQTWTLIRLQQEQ